uniref:Abnormal cell migration protein 18-like fibronectin type I domain-containing protein n=1 Tax=Plectus sambesii TaxID=2011161 RepID=A0A914XHM6_9BILA
MFLAFAVAIIIIPAGIFSAPLARLPKRNCLGGRKHGTQVDLQDYWYFCNDGKLENRGCFAQHRKRVVIGEQHIEDGLETLCYEDEFTGELRLKYTGCSVDGELHGPNDFWNDPSNRLWYFCEQLGSESLRLNYGGCVWDEERIAKGKQIVRDGVVYTCHEKIADQEPGLRPSGCMHFAKRFNLGNTFETEDFWYTCELSADGTRGIKKARGCVHNGKRLEAGDRYSIGDVIFQCTLHPEPVHEPFGCVVKSDELDAPHFYPIGARWTAGYAPYKYQLECLRKDAHTTVQ